MRDRLNAVLSALGEAPVAETQPHSRSRRFENVRVELQDGTVRLLRLARDVRSHRGLLHEAAAHEMLRSAELPVVDTYELIDPEVFGTPASLSQWLPGLAGQGVMDAYPETLPEVCRHLGLLRLTLEQRTAGPFAMGVVDGHFQSVRPTWAEEYISRVWDWYRRAEAVGASLGPLSHSLMRLLEDLVPAVERVDQYCLVHGDLRPVNLTLDVGEKPGRDDPPPVSIRGIFDWEFAVIGDPLLAFALPLELPDDALAHVLEGYGTDRAREWLDDDAAIMRLTAYGIGRVMQFLALVVSSQIEGGGMPWGYGMAYASRIAIERHRPAYVREKLERALPDELPVTIAVPQLADPVRAVLRRALGRLAGRPVIGPTVFEAWVGAIGSALRDRAHEDEGWARDGEMLLDALGPGLDLRGYEPIPDRHAWADALDRRIRESRSDRVRGIWWLALEAVVQVSWATDPADWAVSDDSLRGLQSFMEVMLARPEPPDVSQEALLYAVLALACEQRIGTLLERETDVLRVTDRKARILEAWEDLTVFAGRTPAEMDASDFKDRTPDLDGWVVPVVLYASEVVEGLPVPRRQLIGVLCGPADD